MFKGRTEYHRGYTMFEILLTFAIIGLLVAAVPLTINLRAQFGKGYDGRRKTELQSLKRILEDFYNDKGRFPTSSEICYDALSGDNTCHICGRRATSVTMKPYSEKLACDPQSPAHDYLYQVDNDTSPSYYRIYAKLTVESDQAISQLDCQFGCGPPPGYGYNYGVTSTNTFLETHMVKCDAAPRLYAVIGNICNICGNYSQCKTIAGNGATFYYNPEGGAADCSVPCKP